MNAKFIYEQVIRSMKKKFHLLNKLFESKLMKNFIFLPLRKSSIRIFSLTLIIFWEMSLSLRKFIYKFLQKTTNA